MDQYIGRLLDNRYEIMEVIGTGGMAVVYKARCHRLNRLVAIKILKDEFSRDEEFRRRFHAEGEAVAMLSHPNIVQIYDVSTSESANYIVMELIDGITLKQYMAKKGVLNWKETLHFGMQIAKALEHAHGRSIVHRDIKPHNVMVLKNGSVKVTDFGIARVMSKSNTLTKEALGSVHYISPEQAKGGWVDNRSDLYSLGVVMYEMMSGRPPYDGESPVAVAIQHINGGAAMPSTLNPNIPGGLEQIIMKSMALDPKDRYNSATEMLHDLDEFRKDPTILFGASARGVSDETKVLKTPLVSQEVAAGSRQVRTTAEKVAGAAAGAAKPSRAPAGTQQNGQRPQTPGKPAGAGRPAASAGARPVAAPGARPSGTSRPANPEAARRAAASQRAREEMREEIRKEERNRVATIAVIACSVVAVIAIVVFLIALVNGWLIGGDAMVTVPNYVGDYYSQIEPVEGLNIKINSNVYDDEVEAGRVIEQKPEADSQVAQDTVIWLTVSMGPEPEVKTMEDLTGWDAAQAESYLKGQGMNPVLIEEESDAFEADQVIRTEPEVGDELTDGQTINVYYCSVKTVKMLDVLGKDYAVAYSMLDSCGFKDISFESVESNEKEGTVLEQSVDAGENISVTTKIVLTIATAKMVQIENVVGENLETAKRILGVQGFSKFNVDEQESSEEPGTVLKQSVKAGEEVDINTTITLTVAIQKTAKMINVIGQQGETAKENLEDLGFAKVTIEEVENNAEKGEVIKQSVNRGDEIPVDTEIVLTVSKGPAPTEPPVQENTREVVFQLPESEVDYVLSIYQGDEPILENRQIAAGTPSISLVLTGSGVQEYQLYMNDDAEPCKTVRADFG